MRKEKTGGVPMSATDILEELAGLNCGLPELDFLRKYSRELNLVR